MNKSELSVLYGDNLKHLKNIESNSVSLIYIDPPFNTGKVQTRKNIKSTRDDVSGNKGFGGKKYKTETIKTTGYNDKFDNFIDFIEPRLNEAYRILSDDGSLFFHIDWRESANCRILLEKIFKGRDNCINEIIWSYDYGGRGKNKWPCKHDTIYWFAKDPDNYIFNFEEIDRIPYMAPGLVGAEKAAIGKTPTDVWWNSIVGTNSKEKTGYATQKPLSVVERIVKVHSRPGDKLLDFFAGSGTFGDAALRNGRSVTLIDENPQAIEVINKRLCDYL